MISLHYFELFPFSWRLYSSSNIFLMDGKGKLFSIPQKALMSSSISHFDKCPMGWSVCPSGYAVYRMKVPFPTGEQLVFPGLKIDGLSTAKGKTDARVMWIKKDEFEDVVTSWFGAFSRIEDEFNAYVRNNIHEIRSINSDIYNAAYRLNNEILSASLYGAIAKNIEALSELLAARIKFIDFLANPALIRVKSERISVYQRFDKMAMCMRSTASAHGISIEFGGRSVANVLGPPIFEIVPYLMLSNAVKYSPRGEAVRILVLDNDDLSECRAEVENIGPVLERDEFDELYLAPYRGRFAIATGKAGSGVGMMTLKVLIERIFGGSLEFQQSGTKLLINDIPYQRTITSAKFKILGPQRG